MHSSVLGRFLLTALIAFALVGVGVSQLIDSEIRASKLNEAQSHAEFLDRSILSHALWAGTLDAPLSGQLLTRLDRLVRAQVLRAGAVRVKIFSASGRILYSDEHRLIGRTFEDERPALAKVLAGHVQTSVTDLEEPENVFERHFGSLFATYAPLTPRGASEPEAVAEVYQLKGPIDAQIGRAQLSVVSIIAIGLSLLYVFLWPLLRRQTRVLVEQNEALAKRSEQLQKGSVQTIQMLNRIANAKDPYTAGHIGRVAGLAREVGARLDLDPADLEALDLAAEFHDIGKVAVPDSILNKPGQLSDDEWKEVKKHPAMGAEILEGSELFRAALPGILHHHERFDGTGYPAGLREGDIPVIARIITVVDAFDAMTTDRPYRNALSDEEAWRRIVVDTGRQFCPDAVAALASVLGFPPPGESRFDDESMTPSDRRVGLGLR